MPDEPHRAAPADDRPKPGARSSGGPEDGAVDVAAEDTGPQRESQPGPRRSASEDHAAQLGSLLGPSQLAVAESCTAGRICQTVAAVEGSGAWFRGGLIAYQEPVKRELLGVTVASVVSEAAALEMAGGIAALLDTDVAVATTGVTGADPVGAVKPGTVMIATQVGAIGWVATHQYTGETAEIVEQAVADAFAQLERHLRNRADR